jgi:hypothetical protein
MYLSRNLNRDRRRGVILLVVLALLTLFAIVGLTFALYAQRQAEQTTLAREAVSELRPDMDPELLLAMALNKLIFDETNDDQGVYSAMRGHSLARTMYGWDARKINPVVGNATFQVYGNTNLKPYNGVGRPHTYNVDTEPRPAGQTFATPPTYMNPFYLPVFTPPSLIGPSPNAGFPIDDFWLPNYTFFPNDPYVQPPFLGLDARFLREPEYINPAPNTGDPAVTPWWPNGRPNPPWRTNPAQNPANWFFIGGNAPYTYPDLNNMFLAQVRADGSVATSGPISGPSIFNRFYQSPTGRIVAPPVISFFRPIKIDPAPGSPPDTISDAIISLDPNDAAENWKWVYNSDPRPGPNFGRAMPWLKYSTLRPRPADNPRPGTPFPPPPGQRVISDFPAPEDAGGDVKNLIGAPGGNDSIWLDLNAPVMRAPDGRKYKPLFAFLITDLDNRINLNVAGNARGAGGVHASNQGWGPWEINVQRVFNRPGAPEYPNLQLGYRSPLAPNPLVDYGRYGPDQLPGLGGNIAVPGRAAHFYANADFDGSNELAGGVPTGVATMPAVGGAYTPFPTYPQGYGDGSVAERTNHPLLYSPFKLTGDDRRFSLSSMEAMLRYRETNSPALTADPFRLVTQSFNYSLLNNNPRALGMLTTYSMDGNSPSAAPWKWDPSANPYTFTSTYPTGAAIAFPWLSQRYTANVPASSDFQQPGQAATASTVDWRSLSAGIPRLDLNRPLPAYPQPQNGVLNLGNPAVVQQYTAAVTARQQLAADIFITLIKATGAFDPSTYTGVAPFPVPASFPTDATYGPQYNALRYLAQLAVNIVDYIDDDDYITPWNWGADPYVWSNAALRTGAPPTFTPPFPGEITYGTELPRLVINEVYAEFETSPVPVPGAAVTMRAWAELHNPFARTDNTLTDDQISGVKGAARLQIPGAAYSTYQVQLGVSGAGASGINAQSGAVQNTSGAPPVNNFTPTVAQPAADVVLPCANLGDFAGTNGSNVGFYLLGPAAPGGGPFPFPSTAPAPAPGMPPFPVATFSSANMRIGGGNTGTNIVVALRRLACPHLPPDANVFLPSPPNPPNTPNPLYNPYVTVDYMDKVPVQGSTPGPIPGNTSYGKVQPYSGWNADPTVAATSPTVLPPSLYQVQAQAPIVPGAPPPGRYPDRPQQTFFQHNAQEISLAPPAAAPVAPNPASPTQTLTLPFKWLTHMDRQLINPAELLHVSAGRPWDLTQSFVSNVGGTGANPSLFTVTSAAAVVAGPQTVSVPALTGVDGNGYPWAIRPGTRLVVDTLASGNQETVYVTAVNNAVTAPTQPTFSAVFLKPHNPGPVQFTGVYGGTHTIPWYFPLNGASFNRLYRALEFFETRSRMNGLNAVTLQTNVAVPAAGAQNIQIPAIAGMTASGVPWSIQAGDILVFENGTGNQENVRVTAVNDPALPPGAPRPNITATFVMPHTPPAGGTYSITLTTTPDRIPGKGNINTINDAEPVIAFGDPQPSNNFAMVNTTYTNNAPATSNALQLAAMTINGPGGVPFTVELDSYLIVDPNTPTQELVSVINVDYTTNTVLVAPTFVFNHNANGTVTMDNVGTFANKLLRSREIQPQYSVSEGPSGPGYAAYFNYQRTYPRNVPFLPLSTGMTGAGGTNVPYYPGPGLPVTQYPSGIGIDDTILRRTTPNSQTQSVRLFDLPDAPHGAVQKELMTKLFNNFTTRSNVFAVWVTVGFFEVIDDTTRPVKLGAELGRAEGKNIRHRMFSIVDRTNLTVQETHAIYVENGMPIPNQAPPYNVPPFANPPGPGANVSNGLPGSMTYQIFQTIVPIAGAGLPAAPPPPAPSPIVNQPYFNPPPNAATGTPPIVGLGGVPRIIQVPALSGVAVLSSPGTGGPALHMPWQIAPGMTIIVDKDTAEEETVLVTAVNQFANPPTFTANFRRRHLRNAAKPAITYSVNFYRGNQGPQTAFDPRSYPDLVPYLSIID